MRGDAGPLCNFRLQRADDRAKVRLAIEAVTGMDSGNQRLIVRGLAGDRWMLDGEYTKCREMLAFECLGDLSIEGGAVELRLGERTQQQVTWLEEYFGSDESLEQFLQTHPGALHDHSVFLEFVSYDGNALRHAPEKFKRDQEIVLAAFWSNRQALAHAADKLRADRSFVLKGVSRHKRWVGHFLHWVKPEFLSDRKVILEAISTDPSVLRCAAENLQVDRDFVLNAVSRVGQALRFAVETFQSDRDFVLDAVFKNWESLQYAKPEFGADREVVLEAISGNAEAMSWVTRRFTVRFEVDSIFVLEALSRNWEAFAYVNEEFTREACRRFPEVRKLCHIAATRKSPNARSSRLRARRWQAIAEDVSEHPHLDCEQLAS